MKKIILITTSMFIYTSFSMVGQSLNKKQRKTVDSLTNHWNRPGNPGGAIAIIQKNEVLFQNTRGLANVSTNQKITPQTSFQLAQLSDSFIAFALLQLHYGGKLSLEERVNKYLTPFKNAPNSLKIKHLLQQSSGIHDYDVLKNIAGLKDSEPFSVKDALSLLSKQKNLSFLPGTEFAHSRSNMLLATQIIEASSGISFPHYMNDKVFQPLGMTSSFVLSEDNQNNSGFARSYQIDEDGNIKVIPSKKETYAGINIVSSIEDLIKWEKNLMSPTALTRRAVAHFNSFVVLDNGSYYSVPRGKLTYGQKYIHKERGIDTAMITGGIDGFASAIFNFPTENFTVITLSNNGEPYNGYIGMLSAHAIIDGAFIEPTTIDFSTLKTVPLVKKYHKKYEGMYWDALGEISREIRIEDDTLRYVRSNGFSSALIPLSNDKFQMKRDFDDKIYLEFEENNDVISMKYFFGDATPFFFEKYLPKKIEEKELRASYAGNYFSKALGVAYTIDISENQLVASNGKTESIAFNYIKNNVFQGDKWFMGSIEFKKDEDGLIEGFYVKNDLIRNLWFRKTND